MESYQFRLLHFGKATFGCDFGEKLKTDAETNTAAKVTKTLRRSVVIAHT